MTIDYETRGFVYSITLEIEHRDDRFDARKLVEQVFYRLRDAGCLVMQMASSSSGAQQNDTFPLKKRRRPRSLLAEVLTHLGLYVDDNLVGLNKILTLSSQGTRAGTRHDLKKAG